MRQKCKGACGVKHCVVGLRCCRRCQAAFTDGIAGVRDVAGEMTRQEASETARIVGNVSYVRSGSGKPIMGWTARLAAGHGGMLSALGAAERLPVA